MAAVVIGVPEPEQDSSAKADWDRKAKAQAVAARSTTLRIIQSPNVGRDQTGRRVTGQPDGRLTPSITKCSSGKPARLIGEARHGSMMASAGEEDGEFGPAAGGICDLDPRSMGRGDALDDRQAEPRAAAARPVRAPETLEELVAVGGWDTGPLVADRQSGRARLDGDLHGRAFAGMAEGVFHQIAQG